MGARSFQFRLCQNPDCGLRYPLKEGSQFGERCPACLGATVVVAESSADRERSPARTTREMLPGPAVLLDNIRSAWNVGSIFRSAQGFGFGHLYICGITPTPENEQVRKTALGAEETVSWSSHPNAVALLSDLSRHGRTAWSLETTGNSQPIETALVGASALTSIVLVVGNEQAGVDPGVIALSDAVVHIQMNGPKRSFNVAVAFAVAAHTIRQACSAAAP